MTVNEVKFVDMIANHEKHIEEVQKYIKENYNISSSYNEESNTIHIWTSNINECLQLNSAKDFILSYFEDNMINVEFGKKGDN